MADEGSVIPPFSMTSPPTSSLDDYDAGDCVAVMMMISETGIFKLGFLFRSQMVSDDTAVYDGSQGWFQYDEYGDGVLL